MNYKNNFSSRLLACRTLKSISQKALADELGISDAAVTMMEKSKRAPSFEILCALADYFDVSLDYLVGRTDCPDIVTKDKDGNFIVVEAMQPHKD